jgi:membrane-associated phospholipid phosphatase
MMLEMERSSMAAAKDLPLTHSHHRLQWPDLVGRTLMALNIADQLTLAHLICASALAVVARRHVAHWEIMLLIHGGLVAMVVALASCHERRPRLLQFLSLAYPLALFGFFFEEIGYLVHAIHPGWFDAALIKLDYAIFGAHPTVWVEQFSSYWLNEYMQLAYTTYLFLIPGLGIYLWRRGRREGLEVYVVSMCAAYYLCYLIFILFPIEGPHHTLAHLQRVELAGGPFTAFINLIEKHGRVHGGAFPSTHVAGAVVVLVSAYRCAPRLGYALTPLVLSICVSTVYGRYHYAVDVLAGAVMGLAGCWLGAKLWRGQRKRPLPGNHPQRANRCQVPQPETGW